MLRVCPTGGAILHPLRAPRCNGSHSSLLFPAGPNSPTKSQDGRFPRPSKSPPRQPPLPLCQAKEETKPRFVRPTVPLHHMFCLSSLQILSWDVIRILPSSQERLSCLGNMPGSAGHPGMLHLSVPPPRPHLATAARKAPHPVRQKNEWKGGRRWVSLGGGSIRVTWEGTGPPSTLTQPSPAHRLPQTNCKLWPWSASSFCRCRKQGSARAVSVWPGAAQ